MCYQGLVDWLGSDVLRRSGRNLRLDGYLLDNAVLNRRFGWNLQPSSDNEHPMLPIEGNCCRNVALYWRMPRFRDSFKLAFDGSNIDLLA